MIKSILKTLFNPNEMKNNCSLSFLISILILFSCVFALSRVYQINLNNKKDDIINNQNVLEETSLLNDLSKTSIDEIKIHKFKVVDRELTGEVDEKEVYKYSFVENDITINFYFDINDSIINRDANDIYELYGIEKKSNSYSFIFGKTYFIYQIYKEELEDITFASYDYINLNTEDYNDLSDMGKFISDCFAQSYIDYQISVYTVLALLTVFAYPFALALIAFALFKNKLSLNKYKQFLNISIFTSIIPTIIISLITLIWDNAIVIYDVTITIFYFVILFLIKKSEEKKVASN